VSLVHRFLSSGSSNLEAKRRAGAVFDADLRAPFADLRGRAVLGRSGGNRASGEEP
jgi:hypothetical protein